MLAELRVRDFAIIGSVARAGGRDFLVERLQKSVKR